MAAFTKQAIKASFLKLLGMYPLRDISVKMIVEDCGINRKSFYYHYQDIPALLEEILTEQADALLASYQSVHSLEECLTAVIEKLIANKKRVQHIYRSVNRDVFETGLMKLCDYVTRSYMTQLAAAYPICADAGLRLSFPAVHRRDHAKPSDLRCQPGADHWFLPW